MSLLRVWLLLMAALAGGLLAASAAETAALDQAFVRLQALGWGDSREGLAPITQTLRATNASGMDRQVLEKRLAAVLTSSAPRATKAFVCRELSVVGTAESVPGLARLLADPGLAHSARLALERIPDALAAESLRQSLPLLKGRLQVGVINSLGNRQDPLAVPLLADLLTSPDSDTTAAALLALGKIGTVEAAQALNGYRAPPPAELKALASEACLIAAETLARTGRTKEADVLFRELFAAEGKSRLRLGAHRGMLTCANSQDAGELLSEALAGSDAELRALASDWMADCADPETLRLVAGRRPDLPPAGQVALLEGLCARGEKPSVGVARSALSSPAAVVRVAALRAIGTLGDVSDLPLLLHWCAGPKPQESAAARLALVNLPGKDVDEELSRRLKNAGPESVILLQSLAARHSPGAAEVTLSFLEQPGPARLSALEALAVLGDQRQIPALIPLVNNPEAAAREGAQRALEAIVARAGVSSLDAINAAYQTSDGPTRAVLVRRLGAITHPRALQAVRLALEDPEPAVRDAAFAVLADWPRPGAAPDLLSLARSAENPSRRTVAFRGFVRLCRDSDMTLEQRLEGLGEAKELATTTEDKLLLISAWATLPGPEALQQLATCLENPELAEAAGLAMASAAPKLDAEHKDLVMNALRQVIESCHQTNVQERVRAALREVEKQTQP